MKTIIFIILAVVAVVVNLVVVLNFNEFFKHRRSADNVLYKEIYAFEGVFCFRNKYSYKAFRTVVRRCYIKPVRAVMILTLYFIWGYPVYVVTMGSVDLIKKFIKWV